MGDTWYSKWIFYLAGLMSALNSNSKFLVYSFIFHFRHWPLWIWIHMKAERERLVVPKEHLFRLLRMWCTQFPLAQSRPSEDIPIEKPPTSHCSCFFSTQHTEVSIAIGIADCFQCFDHTHVPLLTGKKAPLLIIQAVMYVQGRLH